MYHYVRDLKNSKYPGIKGLDLMKFQDQIKYFCINFSLLRMEDLLSAILHHEPLPENSLLLTFDDAYRDHFDFVFPILQENNLQGSFFPPVKSIVEHKVLDVNRIHFILASCGDYSKLVFEINDFIREFNNDSSSVDLDNINRRINNEKGRYDSQEVNYIKKMLQKELPEYLRDRIINELFCRYVTNDETDFAHELYMSKDQITILRQEGMFIGGHGYSHHWLNAVGQDQQVFEVGETVKFLNDIWGDSYKFVFCYPYGAWDKSLLDTLEKARCIAGLTTRVDIADLTCVNPLLLPRIDTNDILP